MMKHALVLSGGGALGAYEAGWASEIIRFYGKTDSPISIVSGSSIGAINAALIADSAALYAGVKDPSEQVAQRLYRMWYDTHPRDFMRRPWLGPLGMAWRLIRGKTLFDLSPMRDYLAKVLDPDRIAQSPIELYVHATDLELRRPVLITNTTPNLLDGLRASAAMPGAFEPVTIEGLLLVDGGVVANTPMAPAVAAGAELLTIIYLDNEPIRQRVSLATAIREQRTAVETADTRPVPMLRRTIETMMARHLALDLDRLKLRNRLVEAGAGADGERFVQWSLVQPARKLPGTALDFDQRNLRDLLGRGVLDASNWLRG